MISLELYVFLLKLFHILERIFPKICVLSQQFDPTIPPGPESSREFAAFGAALEYLAPILVLGLLMEKGSKSHRSFGHSKRSQEKSDFCCSVKENKIREQILMLSPERS